MSVKVYWSKNAIASSGNQSSYGDAREADESGSETLNTDGSSVKMMGAFRSSIRGGATFRLERSYWAFNMSSYQGTTLAGLKFNFINIYFYVPIRKNNTLMWNGFEFFSNLSKALCLSACDSTCDIKGSKYLNLSS